MLRTRNIILSLICSLLLLQSAAAMHDVEHQTLGHEKSCKIFLSADHQTCIETSEPTLSTAQISQQIMLQGMQLIITRSIFGSNPRAPPIA